MPSATLSKFESVIKGVMPELPGITRNHLLEKCQEKFMELCLKGWAWIEDFEIDVVSGVSDYPISTMQANTLAIGVLDSGNLKNKKDFVLRDDNRISIIGSDKTGLISMKVIVMPLHNYSGIPIDLEARHSEALKAGVKYSAMMDVSTKWGNPNMAQFYKNEWDASLVRILANTKEGGTESRHGKSDNNHPYYL